MEAKGHIFRYKLMNIQQCNTCGLQFTNEEVRSQTHTWRRGAGDLVFGSKSVQQNAQQPAEPFGTASQPPGSRKDKVAPVEPDKQPRQQLDANEGNLQMCQCSGQ